MTEKASQNDGEPQPTVQESQQDSLAEVISPLIPLAQDYIETQKLDSESRHRLQERQLDFAEKRLVTGSRFINKALNILALAVFGLFALSAGITFVLDDPSLGIQVLSHVGAAIAGILSGVGFTRSRQGRNSAS